MHLGVQRAAIAARRSRFILPAVQAPGRGRRSGGAAADRPGNEKILLVEDEPGVRQLVQRVLSRRGYHVLDAGDVAHAFEIATDTEVPFISC